jgi:hypothetical protein
MFEWSDLFNTFSDATVYFVMACIATLLFLARLGMAVFFGLDDGGGDMDMELGDGGVESGESTAAFSLFSLLSILAFFMGAGWMGLAARLEWGLGAFISALLAAGFGILMGLVAAGLAYWIRTFESTPTWNPKSAVGSTARVYLTIPDRGKGRGQVEVTVDGRRKVLDAVSTDKKIDSFKAVTVMDVRDDGTLVVEFRD